MDKEVPVGIKVIAVLYYIITFLAIIFGLLTVFGAGILGFVATTKSPLLGMLVAGLFELNVILFTFVGIAMTGLGVLGLFVGRAFVGIAEIGIGILAIFVGRGLWKGWRWARIVAIIFACLGILIAVISMIQGHITSNILTLILNLAIGGYLLFNSKVKKAFA